jgi:ribulose-5-phosphate 4-epimerase/fuculose-1-phosphate aldolase
LLDQKLLYTHHLENQNLLSVAVAIALSVPAMLSVDEQILIDLASAYRICAANSFHEGVCNHITIQIDHPKAKVAKGGASVVIRHGVAWAEATTSDMLVFDNFTGELIEGEGRVEVTALMIHAAIHRAHPSRTVVYHAHMPYSTALTSLVGYQLKMINQNCLRFHNSIAYDTDYQGLVEDGTEGDRIAGLLENPEHRVLFMGNHGVMVTGPSLAVAFDDLYYLERACMNQVLALQTNQKLQIVPDVVCAHGKGQVLGDLDYYAGVHFKAQQRMHAVGVESPSVLAKL